MAASMRSARLHEPGQPLRIDTVEIPEPRPRDVLVQVKACGIIPNMNAIFSGRLWNHLPPLPASVGLDAAGVIAKVGGEVTDVAVSVFTSIRGSPAARVRIAARASRCSAAPPPSRATLAFFLIPSASSWIIRLAVFRSTSLRPRSGWCTCRRR
jgi:NADPH:quinone reductase-like Zn-dependent oxidoreductase